MISICMFEIFDFNIAFIYVDALYMENNLLKSATGSSDFIYRNGNTE